MSPRFLAALLALCTLCAGSIPPCRGNASYEVTFVNLLTPGLFGARVPRSGLEFSPVTAVTHSNRVSLLTVRGFASAEVEAIAETGSNAALVAAARALRGAGTRSVVSADGPTLPANATTVRVSVDCANPFLTALAMIAPSPDWIVQISNRNLFSAGRGAFVSGVAGFLVAYDAGTDSGGDFTDPMDASLDVPTVPAQNIAPLVEDVTDRFGGNVVGKYIVKRVA